MSITARLARLEAALLAERHAPLPADAVALARAAGLEPDDWQARVLLSTAPRLLLNCSRQSGKSTVSAALALWTALARPDSLVLLLSPSLRQSQELFRKALAVYRMLERPVSSDAETALRLELANGSRMVSLPGTEGTIRGYSGVRLLVIDEAARVPDELYYSVRPMLAVSGGQLVALSTPWGRRGWWYEAWTGGEPWERVEVPAALCQRIPAAFLEEERRSLPRLVYASEYQVQFVDAVGQLFGADLLARAFTDDPDAAPLALDWGDGGTQAAARDDGPGRLALDWSA